VARRTLVLGGIRSGKSVYAERLVAGARAVSYVATAPQRPDDAAWTARVAAHRQRRPGQWRTVETAEDPAALPDLLRAADSSTTMLVDDVGGWSTTVLDVTNGWGGGDALDRVRVRCDALATAVRTTRCRLVLVSPEVGWGVVPSTPSGRLFADVHGALNQALAGACDAVVLVVAGLPLRLADRTGRPGADR